MNNFFRNAGLILLVLFCLTANVFSNDLPKGLTIQKDGNGYIINFVLPDYKLSDIKAGGETYLNLVIPEYGVTPEVGLPLLPQISFDFMIAMNESAPGFEILSVNRESRVLQSKIYPAQMPWEKNKPLEDRPFTINREYYSTKGSIDEPMFRISEPFVISGTKGVMVSIHPFAYNPSTNTISVTKTASIRINLRNQAKSSVLPFESFHNLFKKIFVNYEGDSFTPTNNYLIITPPQFEARMSQFVSHKTGMGYNVFMVNTTVTGTTTASILAYIQSRYNNIATRPEFILLVGDSGDLPGFTGIGTPDNPYTDLNYTLLEGSDAYADVFLGRFPVADSVQLGKIINKSISMESSINGLPKKNVFMASTDNYAISEGTHNNVIDSFFTPGGYTNIKLYTHTYSATTAQLTAALNANQTFAIYSGHGSETSWADGPPFTQSNVTSLTNTVYPFVYSFACLTGSFSTAECFGETWIRSQRGASVFWGSSVTSYWTEDDILERRLIKAMFLNNLTKTSPMFNQAKVYLVQYFGSVTSTMRRYIEMYNCFGDPSIYQATYGPAIGHSQLPNFENLSGPYTVNCTIAPAGSAIDPARTKLFWTRASSFDSLSLTNTGGNNWSASIPGNGSAATYKYYIRTADVLNRVVFLPSGAPANYFQFTVSPDFLTPVITHTPITDVPKANWPAIVTANVTDNIGVDSVWVKWYKNTPSNSKQFRLPSAGGTVYSAAFNSIQSEVNFNDSIFYKIFARDNSSNHNADSTALYKFKITNIVASNVCKTLWLPIRDNVTSYDSFQVGTHTSILKVNFTMSQLIHTYDGDVTFALRSPAGTELILSLKRGSSGDNFINTVFNDSATTSIAVGTAPFTGTFLPESPLSVFTGQDPFGWWRLRVTDDAGGDTGHVGQYCVQIYSGAVILNAGIENTAPKVFALSQNYPNPFNPTTQIRYDIARQSFVTLKVYDLLGREITNLVNEVKQPGSFIVDFNASSLSSGVYFYKIQAGEFVSVKRMVLIK